GVNTLTETREVLIRDVNERGAYPLVDDIENIDLSVEDDYSVTNNGGPAWVVNQNVSNGSGTKSLYINNRVQTASSGEDVIVSNTIDLSNYSGEAGLEIAFDYAFAQRTNADNSDVLRLTVSNDCGETWRSVNLGTLTRFSLRTKTEQESGNFVPAGPEEWKSRACPIPEDLLTSNFQFRFVWVPGEGNNLYLDNIRIQEQGTSSVLTNDVLAKSFEVYPNPVKNRINVSLDLPAVDKMDISLYNVLGAKQGDLFSGDLPAGANELGFDLDVKPGVYFVRIEADGIQSSKRIVVQ
ncbi:MAG: T9SS type A sorting domain-containing protein, partial [Luteibaculum sp.]